jgi:general secretion pathway protein G
LVVVVVIIGVLAAIAVPRLSRGGVGASEAAYSQSLTSLRGAIERYRAEHGVYPTCLVVGGNKTTIMSQLTQYTDDSGDSSPTVSGTHRFGPYLREIPGLTVSDRKGRTKVDVADGPAVGWIYDPSTGTVRGNTGTATNGGGTLYSDY